MGLAVPIFAFIVGAIATACFWIKSKLTYSTTAIRDSPVKGNPQDAVVLYGWRKMPMPPGDTAHGASPFVSRLEAWLRFANIPYKYVGVGDPSKSPKGQLPYIKHGNNTVGDTTFIIKYLQATYGNSPTNSALIILNPEQQALSTLCTDVALERLAYLSLYYRFLVDSGWNNFAFMLSWLPKLVQYILLPYTRAKSYSRLFDLGYARHSKSDVNKLLHDDFTALSTILGDKPYLLGNKPCDADAAVFAVLDQCVCGRTVSPELNQMMQRYPNLCQYTFRIHESFFPDEAQPANETKAGKAL